MYDHHLKKSYSKYLKKKKQYDKKKIEFMKNKIAIQIKKSFDFAKNDKFPEVS